MLWLNQSADWLGCGKHPASEQFRAEAVVCSFERLAAVLHIPRVFAGVVFSLSTYVSGAAWATTIGPAVQVGTTTSTSLQETSGLAGSVSMPGVLWMHNDAGDTARFFAVATDGSLLGQFSLIGATNVDWEDIAIGPKAGGGSYLYLGDIGDNDSVRTSIEIYRTTEPTHSNGGSIVFTQYQTALLQYPTGPRNAESLMVDPLTGDLFIVTKNPGGQIYRATADVFDVPGKTNVLQFAGNVDVAIGEPSAADISPDGLHILIRNRSTTAYLWNRSPGQSVTDALQTTPLPVTLAAETQGEAIGWAADGSGFFTTSEWDSAGPRPIYFYAFSVPEPGSAYLLLCGMILAGLWRMRAGLRA